MSMKFYCDVCGIEVAQDKLCRVQINIYKPGVNSEPVIYDACPDHVSALEKAIAEAAPKKDV